MTDALPPHMTFGDAWRSTFAFASYLKHALLTEPMTAGDRLECLECLASMGTAHFSGHAAIAAIRPADRIGADIICEALRHPDIAAGFGVLERDDVFANLATLNPSLRDARRVLRGEWQP